MKIRKTYSVCLAIIVAIGLIQLACKKYDPSYSTPDDEWLSGGAQTVYDQNSSSFGAGAAARRPRPDLQ